MASIPPQTCSNDSGNIRPSSQYSCVGRRCKQYKTRYGKSAQLVFDLMKDFDNIVPNAISYKMSIEAYAKNGGDKNTLDSIFNQLSSSLTISYYKVCLIF